MTPEEIAALMQQLPKFMHPYAAKQFSQYMEFLNREEVEHSIDVLLAFFWGHNYHLLETITAQLN